MGSIEEVLPFSMGSLKSLDNSRFADQFVPSVRLWLLLGKLYQEWSLPSPFGYEKDIRPLLFSQSHPQSDHPQRRGDSCTDPTCICQQSLGTLLPHLEGMSDFSQALKLEPQEWATLLQTRPFRHSHRTCRNDLNTLADLGWLHKQGNSRTHSKKFRLCSPSEWPLSGSQEGSPLQQMVRLVDLLRDLVFMDPQIAVFIEEKVKYISEKRLYYRTDYIIDDERNEEVEELQETLFHLWKHDPICPIKIRYNTRQRGWQSFIVYPVCLFYARRAKYLSAYGQSPNPDYDWHHFRLDRIQDLQPLAWGDPHIPATLRQAHNLQKLPTPETVTEGWDAAWGTDFYLPQALLLLRFPPDFAQRYVLNTQRHPSFQPIPYEEISTLVKEAVGDPLEQRQILGILQQRLATDVYFQAWVRVGDTDLTMRLRDWRPNGEVIAPIPIREQMRQEVEQELRHYREKPTTKDE